MADPMTPERLAEIRDLSMNSTSGYATYNPDIWTLDAARRELVAEVERLRHDLDVQRAAMATMLADERQMQAAHDRTRAERDDYRARLVATDRAYAEQAARADAAERERDQMAKRIEQGRQAAVVYAERIAEVEAERDRLAEQVQRVADEAEARAAKQAFNDPYEYGQAIGLRAAAAGLREVLDGTGAGQC